MNRNRIPPLTASTVEQLRTLIESAAAIEAPLREWEITLACGHSIRYQQHVSLHAPDSPTWTCTDCGRCRRAVTSVAVNDDHDRAWRLREARVEYRLALGEVARLKRQLTRAEQRVATARNLLHRAGHNAEPFRRASTPGYELNVADQLTQHRPA